VAYGRLVRHTPRSSAGFIYAKILDYLWLLVWFLMSIDVESGNLVRRAAG